MGVVFVVGVITEAVVFIEDVVSVWVSSLSPQPLSRSAVTTEPAAGVFTVVEVNITTSILFVPVGGALLKVRVVPLTLYVVFC